MSFSSGFGMILIRLIVCLGGQQPSAMIVAALGSFGVPAKAYGLLPPSRQLKCGSYG